MRAVQVFESVVRCGSFAAACKELHLSPGAISQHLRNLENSLNARLFERSGRSLTLTTLGKIYFERVRLAFEEFRIAQDTLLRAKAKTGIVISAVPSLAIRWLRPLLLLWRKRHPGMRVRLIATEEEADLSEHLIDFRICYGAKTRHYEHFTELFRDSVVPACAPELLKTNPVAIPRDILTAPIIDIEWDVRFSMAPTWDDWGRSVGVEPLGVASELAFSLSSAGIDAALGGDGFVLGQIAMIIHDVMGGKLVIPIDHRLVMPEPYNIAWERAALDRPYGAEFKAFLLAHGRHQAAVSSGRVPLSLSLSEV